MALQHRQRLLESVAIAVVEGEGCERDAPPPGPQARHGLGERDELIAEALEAMERRVQEFGRDLEDAVRRKAARRARAHLMQRQNDADATRQRCKEAVEARLADRVERRGENGVSGAHPDLCSKLRVVGQA